LPLAQGTRVMPSGRRSSEVHKYVGSLTDATPALVSAR
jgi:hypothetical protein